MATLAMHARGLSTGMSVNDALVHIWEKNESAFTKLTDEQISQWMKNEFDGVNIAIDANEVARRRRQFNSAAGPWKDSIPPFTAHRYDTNGTKITEPAYIPRTPSQAAAAGLTEDTVRQIVQQELSEMDVAGVDEAQVQAIVERAMASRPVIQVNVSERNHTIQIDSTKVHKKFQECLDNIKAGIPVFLVGPAGSGKTTLAKQLAAALGLNFTFNSMSPGIPESALLGRMVPVAGENGGTGMKYKPSPFVVTFSQGGLHLIDEMDASDPGMLVQINAAIANRLLSIPFADDVTPFVQHETTVIIAAANTFGTGPDRMYVGRNQLDAATVDRFIMGTVEVDYDRDLEKSIALAVCGEVASVQLLGWAWKVRDLIASNKLRRIMSTRTIENAAKLLATGKNISDIKQKFFASWTDQEKSRVTSDLLR